MSAPQADLLGAATGRAEAHTIRLALIYALLHRSPTITRVHLDAALALWAYAHASTRWTRNDGAGRPTEVWVPRRQAA